jgi:hypothetical protein
MIGVDEDICPVARYIAQSRPNASALDSIFDDKRIYGRI